MKEKFVRFIGVAAVCVIALLAAACETQEPPASVGASDTSEQAWAPSTAAPVPSVPATSAAVTTAPASSGAAPSSTQAQTSAAPATEPAKTSPPTTAAPRTTAARVLKTRTYSTGALSPLTGLPLADELVGRRPAAVMINNIKASMPQIGISNAQIIYECLAEGGITRLIALFEDYENLGTVGSVRSARDYFIDLAQIHDALFIHAGGSEEAYSQIKSRSIDHLDGVRTTVSGVFWRDSERRKTMAYEHTMVTSGENIAKGVAKMGYRTTYRSGFASSLAFNSAFTVPSGTGATYIKIPHSNSYVAEFDYDASRSLYLKKQFGKAHIDGANGEQLSFTNVIVIYADQSTVDSYGRLDVKLLGSGKGWYASGGKVVPITWTRSDRDGGISLSDASGALRINPGKSYIAVAASGVYSKTVIN